MEIEEMGPVLEAAQSLLAKAGRVVVLTGAGISTESGIPDFRGPNGVWTRNPGAERMATLQTYLSDPEVRRQAWRHRLGSGMWDAEPNAGHLALLELERRGKLDTLITQNVDGLHHKAGHDPALIVEVHGNVREVVCLSCGDRGPMEVALERVRAGEEDPRCDACGGILKSATISFGQSLVPEDLDRAERAARRCDLMLAVGTSLTVTPICEVVPIARRSGAAVVIVNGEPTPYDPLAEVVINAAIGEVLPCILA